MRTSLGGGAHVKGKGRIRQSKVVKQSTTIKLLPITSVEEIRIKQDLGVRFFNYFIPG